MSGNAIGALKARQKNLDADPDFYKKIGALSWKNPERSHETGFALVPEDIRKELGAKGGRKTKKEYRIRPNTGYIVDPGDLDRVSHRKWYKRKDGYFEASFNYKKILLHRFIMQPPEDMVVDHINHDKSDNRKENLIICTQKENSQNRIIGNKACVYLDGNKWQAHTDVLRARFNIGRYDTKEEAINAVKAWKNKKRQETAITPEAHKDSPRTR